MQTAVLGFLGVGVAAVLADLLVPADEGRGTKRALHTLLALAVLLLLLQPFLGFLRGDHGELPEWVLEEESEAELTAEYEAILQQAVSRGSETELKTGLRQLLQAEYGIAPEDVAISVQLRGDGTLARIELILSGKALLTDPHQLAAAIADKLQCEVEVR